MDEGVREGRLLRVGRDKGEDGGGEAREVVGKKVL